MNLANGINIVQTPTFRKAIKKLHANQKNDLDAAVNAIAASPEIGDPKIGDLAGIHVYKFMMLKQLTLLAYTHEKSTATLTLLALGSHENFYRNLKT